MSTVTGLHFDRPQRGRRLIIDVDGELDIELAPLSFHPPFDTECPGWTALGDKERRFLEDLANAGIVAFARITQRQVVIDMPGPEDLAPVEAIKRIAYMTLAPTTHQAYVYGQGTPAKDSDERDLVGSYRILMTIDGTYEVHRWWYLLKRWRKHQKVWFGGTIKRIRWKSGDHPSDVLIIKLDEGGKGRIPVKIAYIAEG